MSEGEVFFDVEQARDWIAAHGQNDVEHFYIKVLEGDWLVANRNIAWDNICPLCRGGRPTQFCVANRLKKSFRAKRAYGIDVCVRLCQEWCRRMQFLFSWWESHDFDNDIFFPVDVVQSYDDVEFAEWMLSLNDDTGDVFNRAQQIRDIMPLNMI